MTTLILAWAISGLAFGQQANPRGDCGFSKVRKRHVSDFVQTAAILRVTPEYRRSLESRELSGTVSIAILIDKRGRVYKTCPANPPKELKPDGKFIAAAEAAAARWTFQPNFGLGKDAKARFEFIQDVIVFKFVPPKVPDGRN